MLTMEIITNNKRKKSVKFSIIREEWNEVFEHLTAEIGNNEPIMRKPLVRIFYHMMWDVTYLIKKEDYPRWVYDEVNSILSK